MITQPMRPRIGPRPEIAAPLPRLSDDTLRSLSGIFELLADPSRLKIILTLAREGEQHVSALCKLLTQSQPAVSHHLKRLRDGGLLVCRRQGKNNFYALKPGCLGKLLKPLFAEAKGARQIQFGDLLLGLREEP